MPHYMARVFALCESEMNELPLGQSGGDKIKSIVKGSVGLVPFAGSALTELVENLIPNFRIDRIEKYIAYLKKEIESRPNRDEIEKLIKTENNADLFEEGARQSLRALSEAKKQYIVKAVVNGISEDEIDQIEAKRMLRLLSDTDDAQVIVLSFYALKMWGNWPDQQEFEKKYPDIFGTCRENRRRALLREEAEALLELSGLIKTHQQYGLQKKYSELGDEPKLEMLHQSKTVITPLGGKFLEQIGLLSKE